MFKSIIDYILQKVDDNGVPADNNQMDQSQNAQVQEPLVGQGNNAPEIQQPEVINLENNNQMAPQQQLQPMPDVNNQPQQNPDMAAAVSLIHYSAFSAAKAI